MNRADNVNPAMLAWARKTSGLSAEQAAGKIGLKLSTSATAAEKLQALETGQVKPTRKQLEKIAHAYWQPLTTFYLSSPPDAGDRGVDFRQHDQAIEPEDAARLNALLRNLRARQRMVRSLLEDDDDTQPLPWAGSISNSMPVKEAASRIRTQLGIEDVTSFCQRQRNPTDLFSALRRRTEELGVFVLLVSDLGSHHTAISEKVFRGFAIADDLAPFIMINSRDAKVARSFTLIHELTHVMIGSTGVSAPAAPTNPATPEEKTERFCNDAASEFLLPEESLPTIAKQTSSDAASAIISGLANRRNVSEPMVAYRLWRAGRIPAAMLRELLGLYGERWKEMRKQQRAGSSGGAAYYPMQRFKNGAALLKLVGRALRANELTHTEAARILGVSSGTVGPLLKADT